MTAPSPEVREVLALPKSGRRAALEDLVIAGFADILGLPAGAEFPRQRLTRLLGDQVRVETLFEHATMDSLLEHLVTAVLPDLARETTKDSTIAPPAQLDELLERLYR